MIVEKAFEQLMGLRRQHLPRPRPGSLPEASGHARHKDLGRLRPAEVPTRPPQVGPPRADPRLARKSPPKTRRPTRPKNPRQQPRDLSVANRSLAPRPPQGWVPGGDQPLRGCGLAEGPECRRHNPAGVEDSRRRNPR
jgi:hypothetical protein